MSAELLVDIAKSTPSKYPDPLRRGLVVVRLREGRSRQYDSRQSRNDGTHHFHMAPLLFSNMERYCGYQPGFPFWVADSPPDIDLKASSLQ